MPKADSSLNMLIVAAVVALGIGYYVPQTFSQKSPTTAAQADTPKAAAKAAWAASAPGRVEPMGGEIRISAQAPGRIAEVLVGVNDRVAAGDLMVRLADEDLVARVHAARAEVAARKRDRDNETVVKAAQDRRTAEDNFTNAERALSLAREDLDRALKGRRNEGVAAADADKAREAVKQATDRFDQTRTALRKAMASDSPAQTRLEAGLAAARAELSLAEAALERARIRAPSAGTVLQVHARVGETAAPSPESPLVVVGDVSALRVRAEFEERDIGKIRIGQAAVVRSDAFAGRDFEGKVSSLAQALGPSKLGQRGPRRPTDVDVLEVIIDLTGQPPLLPGMRVDVFLKAETSGQPAAAANHVGPVIKAN
ncbi:MAG: efflux RND transporter periplasmic adaptor subunit [Hyphomonadaceae bacterium]|nr:efflux RND transporter periplasmic adaptor subunit [Hyphomonadaceae bacterium]